MTINIYFDRFLDKTAIQFYQFHKYQALNVYYFQTVT